MITFRWKMPTQIVLLYPFFGLSKIHINTYQKKRRRNKLCLSGHPIEVVCWWLHKREVFGKISILFSISSMGNYVLVILFSNYLPAFISSSFFFFLVLLLCVFLRKGGIVCNNHFLFFFCFKKQSKETRERK